MGAKKKYPEPYRRSDSKIYYFIYLGKDGRRRKVCTGLTAKEETRHFIRYRQEGKGIGLNHLSQCRSLLDKHVIEDPAFSRLAMNKIKRGDLLDLRRRLQEGGLGVNSLNKCISTVKTILSEACFRGDIENNPGSMVGNIKYERQERGVLNPEEVGSFLAFLGERTERIKAEARDAAPIKKGAKESRRSLDAPQAVLDEALIAVLSCSGMRAGELRLPLVVGGPQDRPVQDYRGGQGQVWHRQAQVGQRERSSWPSSPWTASRPCSAASLSALRSS